MKLTNTSTLQRRNHPFPDSDPSDINLPVIEITKHRKKWFRKRARPFKKLSNQACKLKSKYGRKRVGDDIQRAKVNSMLQ